MTMYHGDFIKISYIEYIEIENPNRQTVKPHSNGVNHAKLESCKIK